MQQASARRLQRHWAYPADRVLTVVTMDFSVFLQRPVEGLQGLEDPLLFQLPTLRLIWKMELSIPGL